MGGDAAAIQDLTLGCESAVVGRENAVVGEWWWVERVYIGY